MRKPYKSYVFRTQDPVVKKVLEAINENGATFKLVHERSGVSQSTLSNWKRKKTMRPMFATVTAAARAVGHDFKLVRSNT